MLFDKTLSSRPSAPRHSDEAAPRPPRTLATRRLRPRAVSDDEKKPARQPRAPRHRPKKRRRPTVSPAALRSQARPPMGGPRRE